MILIVDYKAGNLTSVKRALDYLGVPNKFVSTDGELQDAERIIFPGVGHAATAMAVLRERGFDVALRKAFEHGIPIMGICLGAQIVLSHSDEGDTVCLGLIDGNCPRFELEDKSLKIPHMGWNEVTTTQPHYILKDIEPDDEFYFVHSFYPQPHDEANVYATCEYESAFPTAIGYKNLFATQFHPEKSGRVGLNLLRNFSRWNGIEEEPDAE
ncbi:MAG: imidazole glycerol phosphate synthase subunit HisH [Chloroflexi bacterium]|nr:imidazole glycerol phosphate synthase subunit HisH [Chloroflexota bacterium]